MHHEYILHVDGVYVALKKEASERFHVVDPVWVHLQKQSSKVEDILGRVPN